jgi:hypothetical protein
MKVFWALVLFLEYNCGHVGTAKDELTIEEMIARKQLLLHTHPAQRWS